jgi:hypothetical protein
MSGLKGAMAHTGMTAVLSVSKVFSSLVPPLIPEYLWKKNNIQMINVLQQVPLTPLCSAFS